MAAEPWIDHNDIEYWQETIEQDFTLARTLLKVKQYFMCGFKCYEATKKILCCWFIAGHPVYELPDAQILSEFSQNTGVVELMSPEEVQLMTTLDTFHDASSSSEEKAVLSAKTTQEDCENMLAAIEELRKKLRPRAE